MLESSVTTTIKKQEYERNVDKLDREIRLLKQDIEYVQDRSGNTSTMLEAEIIKLKQ